MINKHIIPVCVGIAMEIFVEKSIQDANYIYMIMTMIK